MVSRIIDHYCSRETELFVEVAEVNGIGLQHKYMSIEMTAVIFYETNIGTGASRVVNQYFTEFIGRIIMLSEK